MVEKGQLIAEDTLSIYLDIVRYTSSHFDEVVPLSNMADARNVFDPPKSNNGGGTGSGSRNSGSRDATNPSATRSRLRNGNGNLTTGGTSDFETSIGQNISKKREDALQQTLAAWLNFAKGAVDWDEDITVDKGTGRGTKATPAVVMPFNEVIAQVETILNNPDATHDDLAHAKSLAEAVNQHDKDNPDCETGSGSGAGRASKSSKRGDHSGSGDGSKNKKGK
jgi:hypothetical protein